MPAAAARLRSPRGLTIVEMAVVLLIMGILLALTLPHLAGSQKYAAGEKAQTTASGAMDTAVQLYTAAGVRDGTACSTQPSGTHAQMDPGPYTVADPATNTASWTSCPPFANPNDLGQSNGDVRFVAGDQPSTGDGVASVAAAQTPDGWRVAVAVLSPASKTSQDQTSSCWMVWHQFPGDTGGSSVERYFTSSDVTDASACTGNSALVQDTTTACDDPAASGATGDPYGLSWRRPCTARTTS